MSRSVRWKKDAARSLRRIDRKTAKRLVEAVLRYAETGQGDVRRLRGYDMEYRLRVGDWRVRFVVDIDTHTIEVLHVGPRGGVYR